MLLVKGIFLVFFAGFAIVSAQKTVKVSVYYESLCPDSIRFIRNQLNPTYQSLSNYIDLDLVPYGHAIQNKKNGKWVFQCQHGPNECYGNKIQACVLRSTSTFSIKMAFVNCIMSSRSPSSNDKASECAQTVGITWDPIKSCANSDVGDEYLAQYGDQTHALADNEISFVPAILFNDKFDSNLQDQSLRNFKKVVCTQVGNPQECN